MPLYCLNCGGTSLVSIYKNVFLCESCGQSFSTAQLMSHHNTPFFQPPRGSCAASLQRSKNGYNIKRMLSAGTSGLLSGLIPLAFLYIGLTWWAEIDVKQYIKEEPVLYAVSSLLFILLSFFSELKTAKRKEWKWFEFPIITVVMSLLILKKGIIMYHVFELMNVIISSIFEKLNEMLFIERILFLIYDIYSFFERHFLEIGVIIIIGLPVVIFIGIILYNHSKDQQIRKPNLMKE